MLILIPRVLKISIASFIAGVVERQIQPCLGHCLHEKVWKAEDKSANTALLSEVVESVMVELQGTSAYYC